MPLKGLRFVKTFVACRIFYSTDPLLQNMTKIACLRCLTFDNRKLNHASFLDEDGNRKGTFRALGPYYLTDFFIMLISNGEKILSNVNVVMRGQVEIENSSFPVAVRDSKTRVLKLPINCKLLYTMLNYVRQVFKIRVVRFPHASLKDD